MAVAPAHTTPDPSTPSSDYKAMMDYWRMTHDLFAGATAVRDAGELYLPRFDDENATEYKKRVKFARYTNVYGDIVTNIAAKPFSEEIKVVKSSPAVEKLTEDIDGQGNNLHAFAGTFFLEAVNNAIDWIFVDYTRVNPEVRGVNGQVRRRSVTEAQQLGARPYWVRVSATEMLAVYTAVINGKEEFVHCRMIETLITQNDDFTEDTTVQVRELTREPIFDEDDEIVDYAPAIYRIWQKTTVSKGRKQSVSWEVVDEGPISIGVIPIVPLVIGQRIGTSWRIKGAMEACAHLQIDLYQQESGLQYARNMTAFPMLTASGVEPERDPKTKKPVKAPVSPRAVLYAPMGPQGAGSWSFIEISAASLKFLAEQVKDTTTELRELGRQPLTAAAGNLTTVTTAFAAQKGNSALSSWSLLLKDALEQAFVLTELWMGGTKESAATVFVKTDYDSDIMGHEDFNSVNEMRKEGDLSRETMWEEAQRRKILSDEFDPEQEKERLDAEAEEGPSFDDIAAAAALAGNPPPNGNNPGGDEDEGVAEEDEDEQTGETGAA